MIAGIRRRLTYANAMASIAVFIALGAGAYAAGLAPNIVKSRQIVNGQVKKKDLADGGVTTEKIADGAVTDADLAAGEAPRFVGAEGQPGFLDNEGACPWSNFDSTHQQAAFFRDPFGVVHLQGLVKATDNGCDFGFGDGSIFLLPAGYRPEKGSVDAALTNNKATRINVNPANGAVSVDGSMASVLDITNWVSLDGISFRCAPSGENGCR